MTCHLGRLQLAIEGKVEHFKRTWPWGEIKDEPAQPPKQPTPDPAKAANQLMAWFRTTAAEQQAAKNQTGLLPLPE